MQCNFVGLFLGKQFDKDLKLEKLLELSFNVKKEALTLFEIVAIFMCISRELFFFSKPVIKSNIYGGEIYSMGLRIEIRDS